MARLIDPSLFGFTDQDIDVAGLATSGGASISGIDDPIRSDGGGYVIASFTGGSLLDREANLTWRAITTGFDGGATSVIVMFCDRLHQPVNKRALVPHSDGTPFDDGSEYESGGGSAEIVAIINGQAGGLRATILQIGTVLPKPLIGGEWFTIVHPAWGERAYNISSVTLNDDATYTIEYRPPLREAVDIGTPLDFENPRCRMVQSDKTSKAINMKRLGSASLSFKEDMRKPV